MATNLPSCFSIQFSAQLLTFLANFTLLKYVKSQRSYGFLATKELIFGFRILDVKDHFSVSLSVRSIICSELVLLPYSLSFVGEVRKHYSKKRGKLNLTRDPTDPILDTASHRLGREVDGM